MAVILIVILDNNAAPKQRHNPYQPNLRRHIVGYLKVKSLNDLPLRGGGKSTQTHPPPLYWGISLVARPRVMSILVGRHTLKEIPSETVQDKMICNCAVARQLQLGQAKYVETKYVETDNFFFIGQITTKQCVWLNVEGNSEEPQIRSGFNFKCKSWLSVARLLLTVLLFVFLSFFCYFYGLRTDDKLAFFYTSSRKLTKKNLVLVS